ncbi:MAG: hypothetical protein IT260_09115, partial [Saprospiraceae bacterium]|nr:hypothetical protein [Saprospiraceae bacterium]
LVLGNPADAASLEIVPGPGWLAEVEQAGWLAAAGAGMGWLIDGAPGPLGQAQYVPQGAQIRIFGQAEGLCGYLATAGGWALDRILGSRSTCLAAGFGGFEGRALQAGDCLAGRAERATRTPQRWFAGLPASDPGLIRVVAGVDWAEWPAALRQHLLDQPFRVSALRDRMGLRLEGPGLALPGGGGGERWSAGVVPGTVQVPPDGQPIVLLADAQTTGGYPRLAQVWAVDLPKLAQMPAGKAFRFQLGTWTEAEQALAERERWFRRLALSARLAWQIPL